MLCFLTILILPVGDSGGKSKVSLVGFSQNPPRSESRVVTFFVKKRQNPRGLKHSKMPTVILLRNSSIMKNRFAFALAFLLAHSLCAQMARDTLGQGGAWARLEIVNGDSTFVMSLRPVRISAPWKFADLKEQTRYYAYRQAARSVYGYAQRAITLYEDLQVETEDMNKRQRRRYLRHEHRELKEDLTKQMKNLSVAEGKVLIKMLERQLDKPFYEILRETRGGPTAAYWNTLGKMWGYNLKEGYKLGADPIIDAILIDYDFGDPRWLYH
jgi:hypothetical protein